MVARDRNPLSDFWLAGHFGGSADSKSFKSYVFELRIPSDIPLNVPLGPIHRATRSCAQNRRQRFQNLEQESRAILDSSRHGRRCVRWCCLGETDRANNRPHCEVPRRQSPRLSRARRLWGSHRRSREFARCRACEAARLSQPPGVDTTPSNGPTTEDVTAAAPLVISTCEARTACLSCETSIASSEPPKRPHHLRGHIQLDLRPRLVWSAWNVFWGSDVPRHSPADSIVRFRELPGGLGGVWKFVC
jgi:hypothetical protein